jgi:hypothetical protein
MDYRKMSKEEYLVRENNFDLKERFNLEGTPRLFDFHTKGKLFVNNISWKNKSVLCYVDGEAIMPNFRKNGEYNKKPSSYTQMILELSFDDIIRLEKTIKKIKKVV